MLKKNLTPPQNNSAVDCFADRCPLIINFYTRKGICWHVASVALNMHAHACANEVETFPATASVVHLFPPRVVAWMQT